jgi:2-deoxy-D-gluconate 3-dehydrogenase
VDLFDLSGKVAIVTGGNGGIGLGMARGLAQAGANIAIAGRNPQKNESARQTLREYGVKCVAIETDVTDESAIANMLSHVTSELGSVDILVNNAGTNVRKRPEDLTQEEWHLVMDTNLTSAFLCSKACYPFMKRAGGGKVLNNGSMLSLFGSPWGCVYGSSKGGIMQLTRSLATAWAEDNIQVNCFLPGWIDTDLTRKAREQIPTLNDKVLDRTPAGRWGNSEDMAGIAVFFASTASDFITGTALPVDGGFSIAI